MLQSAGGARDPWIGGSLVVIGCVIGLYVVRNWAHRRVYRATASGLAAATIVVLGISSIRARQVQTAATATRASYQDRLAVEYNVTTNQTHPKGELVGEFPWQDGFVVTEMAFVNRGLLTLNNVEIAVTLDASVFWTALLTDSPGAIVKKQQTRPAINYLDLQFQDKDRRPVGEKRVVSSQTLQRIRDVSHTNKVTVNMSQLFSRVPVRVLLLGMGDQTVTIDGISIPGDDVFRKVSTRIGFAGSYKIDLESGTEQFTFGFVKEPKLVR